MTMTQSGQQQSSSARSEAQLAKRRERRRWRRQQVGIATVALLGGAILLYPSAASWFSDIRIGAELEAHTRVVQQFDAADIERALRDAEDFNTYDARGLIIDPFSNTPGVETVEVDTTAERYLEQLSLDPSGQIARVTIPAIDVDVPVYHGATDDTLDRGIGHLYGSSLPVGGDGTHAVLTGHSGLPEARFFTDLNKLVPGDLVKISVLGRELFYEVTGSETIAPTDIGGLGIVPGVDMVSLVTCTPIGINTDRLVVNAVRIDPPTGDDAFASAESAPWPMPWWALLAGLAVAVWLFVVVKTLRSNPPAPRGPREVSSSRRAARATAPGHHRDGDGGQETGVTSG